MSAIIESIALKIDTPTGEITPGRGFYQLEEDAQYVQVGAYSRPQNFFNNLEYDSFRCWSWACAVSAACRSCA